VMAKFGAQRSEEPQARPARTAPKPRRSRLARREVTLPDGRYLILYERRPPGRDA
jgi:hypothetical protein